MKVVQALRQISSKLLDGLLGQFLILLHQLKKITASAILKDDPQVVPGLIPVIKFQDVSILQVVKDAHLDVKFVKHLVKLHLLSN